ncbi:MAG: FtsX-like permease family protein [Oscillospiraceae bacterium]|nr:FtsX-like permease family protein [Oscillospiraceae bacterium]
MRFENLLASRYVKAQKRQSAFTVVSIAVAVAVMAMFFVLYGVIMDNIEAYEDRTSPPYHLIIYNWPENKASALKNDPFVQSVSFELVVKGSLTAKIRLDKEIGSQYLWLDSLQINNQVDELDYEWNQTRMKLDGIGSDIRVQKFLVFWIVLIFALLFAFALRLVVDTAFEISSKERERHYGVLQSIGATPKQIVRIITRESLWLCVPAVPLGLVLGIALAFGMYRAVLGAGLAEVLSIGSVLNWKMHFSVRPLMLLVAAVVGLIWTFLSAYGVGMRVVRKTPMDAITARADQVKTVKKHSLSGLFFGLSGRIASRNARRQKKRFRITVLTLTVSITLFALFSELFQSLERFVAERWGGDANGYPTYSVELLEDPDDGVSLFDGLQALEQSGLFQDVRVFVVETLEYPSEDPDPDRASYHKRTLCFVNQQEYQYIFGSNPPVCYDTLASSGDFVFISPRIEDRDLDEKEIEHMQKAIAEAKTGTIVLYSNSLMKARGGQGQTDPDAGSPEPERCPHELKICAVCESYNYEEIRDGLVGALDYYQSIKEDWFGAKAEFAFAEMRAIENGEYGFTEYQQALSFFRAHGKLMELLEDNFGEILKTKNILASIRTGVLFFNCIIALAALINLLNIISTGIANRRSEMASLQCVGMTDGQLLRMTLVECLQYVIKAGVVSAVICILVIVLHEQLMVPKLMNTIYGEEWMLYLEDRNAKIIMDLVKLDPVTIFARIALASALAFAAGSVDTILMLHAQNKNSLTERIHNEA